MYLHVSFENLMCHQDIGVQIIRLPQTENVIVVETFFFLIKCIRLSAHEKFLFPEERRASGSFEKHIDVSQFTHLIVLVGKLCFCGNISSVLESKTKY